MFLIERKRSLVFHRIKVPIGYPLIILSSKDAKKVYTHCTAAALRAKDCVVDKATILQENCSDILAEAKKINEERAAAEAAATFEDEKQ